jgi:hypothetical protein
MTTPRVLETTPALIAVEHDVFIDDLPRPSVTNATQAARPRE